MSIKILLADDHNIMRDGLKTLLKKQPGMEVVGEASDGRSTVKLARALKPDVVLMDVMMPDLNGIEATREILEDSPAIKVLGLSMHIDKRFVEKMIMAGASGYLTKDCTIQELSDAIRLVMENQSYLSPKITGVLLEGLKARSSAEEDSALSVLTAREREIVQLLAEGNTAREIASRLHISVKTVETHRRNVMTKLDISSLADLTKYAIREGLTSIEV